MRPTHLNVPALLRNHLKRERRIHAYASSLTIALEANPDIPAEASRLAKGETEKQKAQRRKHRMRWDKRMKEPMG